MSEEYKDISMKMSITNKKSTISDIIHYMETNATCKCDGGFTWFIDAVDDQTRPAKRKVLRTTDTIYVTLFHGMDVAEPLAGGYRIRRYTTTMFVQAFDEDSIQSAVEEIQSVFYCWEANGGGSFTPDGTPYHRLLECTPDIRGRASASVTLSLVSRMEDNPI